MKKLLVVAVVVTMMLMATSAFAVIKNSAHDLSSTSSASIHASDSGLSACQYCHTPHLGSFPTVTNAPLWNRSINAGFKAGDGTTDYQVYGAATTGATGSTLNSNVGAPGTNSKTCLSCHDGTLSIGTVQVGTDGTSFTDPIGNIDATGKLNAGGAFIGTDLRQEHPIGVVYTGTAGSNNAGLANPAQSGLGVNLIITGDSNKKWVIYGTSNPTVECGSCHDPHQTDAGKRPFLKGTVNSICTDCHSLK